MFDFIESFSPKQNSQKALNNMQAKRLKLTLLIRNS